VGVRSHPRNETTEPGYLGDRSVINQVWLNDADLLRGDFERANPFPHVVLDEFFKPTLAEALIREFPSASEMSRTRDYLFGNKLAMANVSHAGPTSASLRKALLAESFREFLSRATGHNVFVDPEFVGGGFHAGGDGSFLDLHVDFNLHPNHDRWLRTLNVLVYLNPNWCEEYGGHLLITGHPSDSPLAIEPKFNRAVIMLTGDETFHGYQRMNLPPGVTRKLLAIYAYRMTDEDEAPPPRTTHWYPRGGTLGKRTLAALYNRAEIRFTRRVSDV
jgi:hypothetical protein